MAAARPFSLARIREDCVEIDGHLLWRGGIHKNSGCGVLQVKLDDGRPAYSCTTARAVAGLRLGLTPTQIRDARGSFCGWSTCEHPNCCQHVMGGTVAEHRTWLMEQGRTKLSTAERIALTSRRRAAKSAKASLAIARAIRAARADNVPVKHVSALTGLDPSMVRRICNGTNWRENVAGASVFNLAA